MYLALFGHQSPRLRFICERWLNFPMKTRREKKDWGSAHPMPTDVSKCQPLSSSSLWLHFGQVFPLIISIILCIALCIYLLHRSSRAELKCRPYQPNQSCVKSIKQYIIYCSLGVAFESEAKEYKDVIARIRKLCLKPP